MLSRLILGITRNFALSAKPRVAVKSANLVTMLIETLESSLNQALISGSQR